MESLVIPSSSQIPTTSKDPAGLGYPPMLAVEIALAEHPPREICESYGIDSDGWDRIRENPLFVSDVKARLVELEGEGTSFKMRAQLQSLEYLKETWKIATDVKVAAETRLKAMQFIIRAAGLDGSKDQAGAAAGAAMGQALQINLHLG